MTDIKTEPSAGLSLEDASDILSTAAVLGGSSIIIPAPAYTYCYAAELRFQGGSTWNSSFSLFNTEAAAYEALRKYLIEEFIPNANGYPNARMPWTSELDKQLWTVHLQLTESTVFQPEEYIKHKIDFLKVIDIKKFATQFMKGFYNVKILQVKPAPSIS